jgi:hypothetical protein
MNGAYTHECSEIMEQTENFCSNYARLKTENHGGHF